MTKFHINKQGVPAVCQAKEGNCPFGGSDKHFNNKEEAQDFADKVNEAKHSLLPDITSDDKFPESTLKKDFPELSSDEISKLKDYYDLEVITFEITDELKKASDDYKETDEYFNKVQRAKGVALAKYESLDKIKEFADMEKVDEYLGDDVPKNRVWKPRDPNKKSTYNFHPDVTHRNFNNGVGPVISAYTGKPIKQVKEEIQELRGEGEGRLSLQEATESYWRNSEQRTDKPFVSIDLETANPRDRSLAYDGGQLTYIIETGAIKTYPDGTVEHLDFKSTIPKEFNNYHGTGFVETHGIEYKDIKDESNFVNDKEKQKKVMDFLDGSVMIAHNANFEINQFTNSLKGFKGKLNDGSIEVLDTMNFSKYLVSESERNTNEAFVQAAGLEYEGAHRAYQDAQMTLEAFNKLKDNR